MRYPCGMMGVLLGSVTLIACAGDSVGAPVDPSVAPTVAIPNVAVAVTVGTQVGYDATRNETVFNPTVAGTLRYSIVFAGDANGLSAVGGTVVGRSAAPGVTWATVTATDALGRTASRLSHFCRDFRCHCFRQRRSPTVTRLPHYPHTFARSLTASLW